MLVCSFGYVHMPYMYAVVKRICDTCGMHSTNLFINKTNIVCLYSCKGEKGSMYAVGEQACQDLKLIFLILGNV